MKRTLPVKPKRIVVKVGTGILTRPDYHLNKAWIRRLTDQLAKLAKTGVELILVSSGSIGAGTGMLKLAARPKLLPQQQAAAAIGQGQLMKVYDTFFKRHNILTAQVLLTREDLSSRKRYLNAKNTLYTLLSYQAIPIINENDTVSVDEIKFGDNDKLSALVAALVHADLLIMLSDVDGLYALPPANAQSKQQVIPVVREICPEIEKMASSSSTELGTGGMLSKIEAVKICCSAGIACVIANGRRAAVIDQILSGEKVGTLFLPKPGQLVAKKRWIGFSAKVKGVIIVDQGARQALVEKNRSLLPKGVIRTSGNFTVGDPVSILDSKNQEFARGLSNYSCAELNKIKLLNTDQIKNKLGYKYYDEVVHRNNLVIL
ncbi:glutamate 5-kinase [Candidatus Omnitrophota bacterium]